MDLTRDAIEKIQEGAKLENRVVKIGDHYYSRDNLNLVIEADELSPDCFNSNSLCAITEYINKNVNPVEADSGRRYIIHVDSPTKVILKREQNGIKSTHELVLCEAIGGRFPFNQYILPEDFLIKLQSSFENDDKGNRNNLISIASNISNKMEDGIVDDGISQTVTVKKGVALKTRETIVNPIALIPYRTFTEVQQPVSPFVFRINAEGREPRCALFDDNSGMWQIEAMENIRNYFRERFADNEQVIIL